MGYFNLARFHESATSSGRTARLKRLPPSPDAITRMEETLGWRWLEAEDAKLARARAGARRGMICWRFGIAPATASAAGNTH